MNVRPAVESDVRAASEVLAAAFEDYPWTELTVDPDRRSERLRDLYGVVLSELVLPHGRLWVAEDAGRVVGAAGWLTPDSDPPPPLLESVATRVRSLRGSRAGGAEAAETAVQDAAGRVWPAERFWLLGTVGVLPSEAGAGVGSCLLAAGLAEVDRDGAAARLETSLDRNLGLYERVGFTVSTRLDLPDGTPCWLMRREPRPQPG